MAKAVKSVATVIASVAGVVATVASFIPPLAPIAAAARAIALGATLVAGVAGMLAPAKAASRGTAERLQASLVPSASRVSVHGRTAMGTDVRYEEFVGTEQEYLWRVFAVASHRVHSIQELWLDAKLAWSSAGGVTAEFAGYLQVTPILEATATNTVYISPRWSAAARRRLTGCALLYVRFKRTGNNKKAESPFAQAITNRVTIVGEGRLYYDPRRDSTVPGGSGAMRAGDQATWAYTIGSDVIGRNGALGLLNQLLGWRINGKLAVGGGTPTSRLDLAGWITAANLADETVAKAGGGSEPRYRTDGVVTEDEEGSAVIQRWEGAINGRLIDDGGRLSLRIWHNDLAIPVAHFTADDVLGAVQWDPTLSLEETRNVGRGRYIDPSPQALYQAPDYPQITLPSPDGINRVLSADFDLVQSVGQAQRLIKQRLQRLLYGGRFSADFRAVAWGVKRGDVITLDFYPLGFSAKLFRVLERTISLDGRNRMVLVVEHPSIYAWDREEAPAVELPAPDVYDWRNYPLLAALDEVEAGGGPVAWPDILDPDGTKPEDGATIGAPPGTAVGDRPAEQVVGQLDDLAQQLVAQLITFDELETGVQEVDERVTTARERADAAYSRADQAHTRIDTIVSTGEGDFGPFEVRLTNAETAIFDNNQAIADQFTLLRSGYSGNLSDISQRITTVSDAQGASAQRTIVLEARGVAGSLGGNSTFANWPDGQVLPSLYDIGGNSSASTTFRVPGLISRYSMRQATDGFDLYIGSSNLSGPQADPGMVAGPGNYVLYGDFTLVSGVLHGAGLYVAAYDINAVGLHSRIVHFPASVDNIEGAAPGAGVVGRRYRFVALINLDNAQTASLRFHPMTQWVGFSAGAHAKVIDWHEAGVRPATPQEIAAQRADQQLNAADGIVARLNGEEFARKTALTAEAGRITQVVARVDDTENRLTIAETAIDDMDGGEVAFQVAGQAADGRFIFDARARADGSQMLFGADEVIIAAPVPGGYLPVATFEPEGLRLHGRLLARSIDTEQIQINGVKLENILATTLYKAAADSEAGFINLLTPQTVVFPNFGVVLPDVGTSGFIEVEWTSGRIFVNDPNPDGSSNQPMVQLRASRGGQVSMIEIAVTAAQTFLAGRTMRLSLPASGFGAVTIDLVAIRPADSANVSIESPGAKFIWRFI